MAPKKSRSKWSSARLVYLESQKPGFAEAFKTSNTKNWLANHLRRFLKHFPVSLPNEDDPPQEVLDAVDDLEPDNNELKAPDESSMTPEEYKRAKEKYDQECGRLVTLRERIQRWFYNQHAKDRASVKTNPFKRLFDNVFNWNTSRPRLIPAINKWRKNPGIKLKIEEDMKETLQKKGLDHKSLITVHKDCARSLYELSLSAEVRNEMDADAKREHDAALELWEEQKNDRQPSTAPEDLQNCIDHIHSVAQPFLDAFCEATGWAASLIAGGPEPADEGRIHMTMLHSGTTAGAEPMDFGRAEHVRIPALLYPMFNDFLRLAFPTEECRRRALSPNFVMPQAPEQASTSALLPGTSSPTAAPTSLSSPVPRLPQPTPVTVSSSAPVPELHHPADDFNGNSVPAFDHSPSPPPPEDVFSSHPSSPTRSLSDPHDDYSDPPRSSEVHSQTDPLANSSVGGLRVDVDESRHAGEQVGNKRPLETEAEDNLDGQQKKKTRVGNQVEKRPLESDQGGVGEGGVEETTRKKQRTNTGPEPIPSTSSRRRNHQHQDPATTTQRASVAPPADSSHNSLTPVTTSSPRFTKTNSDSTWLTSVITMFSTVSPPLGNEWVNCLNAYCAFQEKHGYLLERRLPTKGRPGMVAKWIGVGRTRTPNWRPTGLVPRTFGDEFRTYWASLQPEWRLDRGRVVEQRVEGNWEALLYPGVNGLLSILACLFFWGVVCKTPTDKRGWVSAVANCTVAFTALSNVALSS